MDPMFTPQSERMRPGGRSGDARQNEGARYPRSAALAGSRRHLGPLNRPDATNRAAGTSPERPRRLSHPSDGPSRSARGTDASAHGVIGSRVGSRSRGFAPGNRRGATRFGGRSRAVRGGLSPVMMAGAAILLCLVIGGGWALVRALTTPAPQPSPIPVADALEPSLRRIDIDIKTPRVGPTPESEWKKGEVPYLFQTDPAWAKEPYAGATIKESGCGPTCLSMIYIALTGKSDMNPVGMADFSEENGYVQEGMTAWTLFTDGAAQLGIEGEVLPLWGPTVTEALEAGKPLVFNVKPGDFTTVGHYIVVSGLTDEGMLVVHDPNSYELSAMAWDLQHILDQTSNIWAFSLA
ncbi:MAG: C39 family peptidase [Collinsella sp.]|nr:C39 family peptidase [Collinsella sp.]